MKKLLLSVGVAVLSLPTVAQQVSVLFLGNSYIYTANLPGTLYNLALEGGDTIYHEQNTPGGYTFEGHSTNTTTLNKIASRDWDFVVLQQQSQMPSFPPSQVASQTYPFAEVLVDSIKSNYECSEPVFFMTWGRRDGDQSNCAGYPPLCTFEGMNERLRESYLEMGETNEATVAPCGAAWHRMSVVNNTFWSGLYSGDGSHPSAWGTYLNACVFYATILRKSPVGIPYYSSIGQQDAEILQQLAEDIVLDSLSNWYIGHQDVISNATDTMVSAYTVDFYGVNQNATEHYWDFGDGNEAFEENPTHQFLNENQTYTVTHIASSVCDADTSFLQISTTNVSINEPNPLEEVEVHVIGNSLQVRNVLAQEIEISVIDYSGKMVFSDHVSTKSMLTTELGTASGFYLVRISNRYYSFTRKVAVL